MSDVCTDVVVFDTPAIEFLSYEDFVAGMEFETNFTVDILLPEFDVSQTSGSGTIDVIERIGVDTVHVHGTLTAGADDGYAHYTFTHVS